MDSRVERTGGTYGARVRARARRPPPLVARRVEFSIWALYRITQSSSRQVLTSRAAAAASRAAMRAASCARYATPRASAASTKRTAAAAASAACGARMVGA